MALSHIGVQAADVPGLLEDLKDRTVNVDVAIAISRAGPDAVPALLAALRQDSLVLRGRVAYILAVMRVRSPEALDALLGAIPAKVADTDLDSWEDFDRDLVLALSRQGPDAVSKLLEALSSKNDIVRSVVLQVLGAMGAEAKKAVPHLMRLLEDKGVRVRAMATLGDIGPDAREALPALLEVLKEGEPPRPFVTDPRVTALEAISRISGPEVAGPLLLDAIQHGNSPRRFSALGAVERMRPQPPNLVPALLAALTDKDKGVRRRAASLLGNLGAESRSAAPALLDLLHNDPDATVRQFAARALGLLGAAGADAVPALIAALSVLDRDMRQIAATALGQMGPKAKAAVPSLRKAFADDYSPVQLAAAQSLWQIDHDEETAVPALVRKLLAGDETERRTAAHMLGGMRAEAAIPALTECLQSLDEVLRCRAAEALWRIDRRNHQVVPVLIEELQEGSESDRRLAAEVLGAMGEDAKVAVPALREVLKHADKSVREAAAQALKKIDPKASE
jgi:HEAT repeat protein